VSGIEPVCGAREALCGYASTRSGKMVSVFLRAPDFDECPICFEAFFQPKDVYGVKVVQPVICLPCNHLYHSCCILPSTYKRLSLGLEPQCPLCRKAISADEITKIESADEACEFSRQEDGDVLVYAGYDHRLVRQEWADGGKSFYEGGQGSEHKVRKEYPNGFKWFYEGEPGAEHVVRREFLDGDKWFYEGEQDAEHVVRKELVNGIEQFYEGEQDAERLVREDNVYDEERKHHCVRAYKGERGAEHVVSINFDNGDEAFFEGEQYAERLVRKVLVDGEEVRFFEGERGAEHLVEKAFSNGEQNFYKGGRGAEHLVEKAFSNGEQNFYKGERGAEHLVEKVFSNGDRWFYQGASGKEVLVGMGKQALTVQYMYTPITPAGKSLKAKYKRVAASDPEYPDAAKRARLVEEFMQG